MYIYMGHMKFEHTQPYENWFWEKNKIDCVQDYVRAVDPEAKLIHLEAGNAIPYDKLILALGSQPRKLQVNGNDLAGIQSLYSKQDLERMQEATAGIKRGVVIGGGLIGVEMAEMLHSKDIEVTMLIRERNFWDIVLPEAEAKLVSKHIEDHGITLYRQTNATEFRGRDQVESVVDSNHKVHRTDFVGITIGVDPNKQLAETIGLETNRGILVDNYLCTSQKDIYAIGDCAELRTPQPGRKPIEPVWYTGRIMGEAVAETICLRETEYAPGIWFNSAKFFDLEYQTYGEVPNEESTEYISLYWEDQGEHALRLVFNSSEELVGINALGIRLKHDLCDQWISDKRSVNGVLNNLEDLNFNPEFYSKHLKLAARELKLQAHV